MEHMGNDDKDIDNHKENCIDKDTSDTKQASTINLKTFTQLLSLLTAFVPVLIVMGYYYEFGWLNGFGLTSSWIDTSIDSLLFSFYSMLTLSWGYEKHIWSSLLMGLVFFVVLMIASYIAFFIGGWIVKVGQYVLLKIRKLKIDKNKIINTDDFKISISTSYLTIFVPLAIFYIVVLVAMPGRIAYELGLNEAKNIINIYEKGLIKVKVDNQGKKQKDTYDLCKEAFNAPFDLCFEYTGNNNILLKGFMIFNNNHSIGLYNGATTVLDKKTGNKITHHRLKKDNTK